MGSELLLSPAGTSSPTDPGRGQVELRERTSKRGLSVVTTPAPVAIPMVVRSEVSQQRVKGVEITERTSPGDSNRQVQLREYA